MCTYIYIYICISNISATALCAFGANGFDNQSDCMSGFSLIALPLIQMGMIFQISPPPWAAFEKHCFCYMSLLIFTISLSGSFI